MLAHPFTSRVWVSIALAGLVNAHISFWHPAMFCFNGTDPSANPYNSDAASHPLYQMKYSDYWIHRFDGCDSLPPDEGVFLDLPAGGSILAELAENRHFTSYNPNAILTEWGDGQNHPENYSMTNLGGLKPSESHCLPAPNFHTQNESMATGTALAISYVSTIDEVEPSNLVVFSVSPNTPWKRVTKYDIPSGMPPCPDLGCICVWGWVPNGCGQRNMFLHPYRCKVIPDSTPAKTIGAPQPARWCEDDASKCVKGPKQVIIHNQLKGNNTEVDGDDLSGHPKTPVYNMKCGFSAGAQNDIFVEAGSSAGSGVSALPSATPTSSLSTGSGAQASPSTTPASNLLAGSGTPALPSTTPTFSLPAGSGAPALPSTTPTSSSPARSGTSALPASAPASSLPAGSGTPTDPNPPTRSSTPTNSPGMCKRSIEDTADAGQAAHSKRMKMHRERKIIF